MSNVDVNVRKTVKLFVNGALVRSESGRTVRVDVGSPCEVPVASRKDARDAVSAAAKAQPGWATRDPYNRGQILYRVAEMVESRRAELEALSSTAAVDGCVAAFVHYAGWCDKLDAVLGSVNPVSGPFQSSTSIVGAGVIAAVTGKHDALVDVAVMVASSLAASNAVIVVVPGEAAPVALTFAEVLMHSDVPGGVVNMLTGDDPAVADTLAAHSAVDGLDVSGLDVPGLDVVETDVDAGDSVERSVQLALLACDSVKRMRRGAASADPLARIAWQVERRTQWQPVGR